MDKLYFTITGTKYRFGTAFMKPEMEVTLKKEPENEYDPEAICVSMEGLGKVGYVANSPHTIQGKSLSAGRLYDRIGKKAKAKVDARNAEKNITTENTTEKETEDFER